MHRSTLQASQGEVMTKPKANPMLAGRKTKYNKAVQKKAENYLVEFKDLGHVVPSVAGLSLALNISKSTLYLWNEKHPIFSDTLERIMALQEMALVSSGLTGEFNSTIVKLMMHNHGYSDKLAVGGDAENPLRVEQITRKIVE